MPTFPSDPYAINGQSVVSFSGGRTSGFMLWNIMQAHGGKVPDDILVCFQNTGLEHPATYDFIVEVEQQWQIPIVWLELDITEDGYGFKVVDKNTAARQGEPFAALIRKRKYLPNPIARFCTVELKIKTLERYIKNVLGWEDWDNAIGLRADEPRRVAKMKADDRNLTPVADAGHTNQDVMRFWESHPFDLKLPGGNNDFGNCVGCFLKGRSKLEKIIDSNPAHFDWWVAMEKEIGSTFRSDRPTYQQMLVQLTVQGRLFDDSIPDESMPCMCHD